MVEVIDIYGTASEFVLNSALKVSTIFFMKTAKMIRTKRVYWVACSVWE